MRESRLELERLNPYSNLVSYLFPLLHLRGLLDSNLPQASVLVFQVVLAAAVKFGLTSLQKSTAGAMEIMNITDKATNVH